MDREKFLKQVYPEPNTGCWIWGGNVANNGYGMRWDVDVQKARSTHRLSYELFVGEIKDGLAVLHKCDVRCCVNPDHLFLGTLADNIHDMDMKNRRVISRGERRPNAIVTADIALAIKKMYCAGGITQLDVAKFFNVREYTVNCIVSGRTWKHVDGINDIKRPSTRFAVTDKEYSRHLKRSQILEIRERHKKGDQIYKIANEYGVWKSTIRDIVQRKTWRNL